MDAPSLWRRYRRWLLASGALLLALLLGIGLLAALTWRQLPDLQQLTHYQPKQPLRVLSEDGELLGEFGAERRRFVPLAQIPKKLQDALLAVEDEDFWTHGGLDFSGMLRAAWRNLTHSGPLHGASTISQQLARDTYLSKQQVWSRKFVEILLTLKMERELSKEQILEIYMNQIFMGNRAYGFAAAAERYFGKELAQLDTAETAMLVGLPKDPVKVNPVVNLPRAKRRQAVVLQRLVEVGLISEADAKVARAQALTIRKPQRLSTIADHAAEMVRAEVVARFGEEAYERGLQVETTLLAAEQRAAQQALRRALFDLERRQPWRGAEAQIELPEDPVALDAALDRAFDRYPDLGELRSAIVLTAGAKQLRLVMADGTELQIAPPRGDKPLRRGSLLRLLDTAPEGKPPVWRPSQTPQAEGAVVTLDPKTGAIRALVGGFDFARNQFNHATQAYRQPGSAFKPFLYSAAIEHGAWAGTLVSDLPFEAGDWAPRNYDGTYEPQLTLRQALARSKNMVSVRLAEHLGPQRVRTWAASFGLDAERQPLNLTIALGTGSVTPMQMARAYGVFASGGLLAQSQLIRRVRDADGKLLHEAAPAEAQRVISERNAFMTGLLLNAVMREGTGARGSQLLQRWDLYGKTGTTNDAVDAWFAGFQASRVGVVWIGYPQPKSLGERETGGGLALPVWAAALQQALRGVPPTPMNPPATGLVQMDEAWFYEEFSGELAIQRIGPPPPAEDELLKLIDPSASAP
jgi:penicillin-binding protein 1A